MSVSDIFWRILPLFVVFSFIIFISVLIIAILYCILKRIKDTRDGAVIISFKNFRKIFPASPDKFSIPTYTKYIYYDHTYKILVRFPFNSLAKMMVRTRIKKKNKNLKKQEDYRRVKRFISALEKDIEKMSKESENYVAQAREIVERIGK